jgi:hypothetical protein
MRKAEEDYYDDEEEVDAKGYRNYTAASVK